MAAAGQRRRSAHYMPKEKTKCEHLSHQPVPLTASARIFFDAYSSDQSLFTFIIDVVLRADFVRHVATEALAVLKPGDAKSNAAKPASSEKMTPSDLARDKPGPAIKFLREKRLALLQMYHCRVVDNFTAFLSALIREAIAAKPEMLRSNEQIRLDYALSFDSIEDLREDLIDRKVGDLGYLGFSSLCKWIEDHMGLKLVPENKTMDKIVEFLETRNAIVHNRGIIGEKYLRTVINPKFKNGDMRTLEVGDYFECCETISACVREMDAAMAGKYGLKTSIYPSPKENTSGGA